MFDNIKYEELVHMDLEVAKEIVKGYTDTFLEEFYVEYNGEIYGVSDIEDDGWDDGGKYQYKNEYGLLVKMDNNWSVIKTYDVVVQNTIQRSGSYFSEYYYSNELDAKQLIEVEIPEVVIPAHKELQLKG